MNLTVSPDSDSHWNIGIRFISHFQILYVLNLDSTIKTPRATSISKEEKLYGWFVFVWLMRWYSNRFEQNFKICRKHILFTAFFNIFQIWLNIIASTSKFKFQMQFHFFWDPCCLRGSETNIILVKSEMVSPETS